VIVHRPLLSQDEERAVTIHKLFVMVLMYGWHPQDWIGRGLTRSVTLPQGRSCTVVFQVVSAHYGVDTALI